MIVEIFILITTRAECRAGRHKPRTLPGVWEGSLSYFWFNTMPAAQHQAVWRRGRDTTLSIEEGGRWKQKGGMGGFLIKCQHDLNSQLWREHMEARAPDYRIEEILFSGSCDSSHANMLTGAFPPFYQLIWLPHLCIHGEDERRCGKRKGAGIGRILLNWYLKKLLSPSA